jgi:copper chaperone CopZ
MTTADEIPSIDLTVEGMTCEGCATKVRSALTATDGVVNADIDVASGRVSVHPDGTVDRGALEFAIDGAVHDAGYSVVA